MTVNVTVPNATPAGSVVTADITLETAYPYLRGIAFVEALNQTPATNIYEIGVKDSVSQVIDFVSSDVLLSNRYTDVDSRFIPMNMETGGRVFTLQVRPLENATVNKTIVQAVFWLSYEKE